MVGCHRAGERGRPGGFPGLVVVLGLFLCSLSGAPAANGAAQEIPVTDFENGLGGWHTNDAVKHSGKSKETPLVSISLSPAAHTGKQSLEIAFHPGEGWANAFLQAEDAGEEWAAAGADELSLWVKGDGSAKEVRLGLQAWTDDLVPTFYHVPLSLRDTEWRQVVVPLARFQESNPQHPLRLPALISLQVDGSGALGPARLWVDDITVRNAHGEGARYAAGPLDDRIVRLPPAREISRLGTWGLPRVTPETLAWCRGLGLGFGSSGAGRLQQGRAFIEGIASNHTPGRPPAGVLVAGLGLTAEDFDQDSGGSRMSEGMESAVFHPEVVERFCRYVTDRVRARKEAPWVTSFMLSSPISRYGEVHYAASSAGKYAVFSRPARQGFRDWLERAYGGDLAALSRAWGENPGSWDEVRPPEGPEAGPEGIDTRTRWSDFMHWYNDWLEEVTRRSLEAARSETGKPLAVMMGGPKVGPSQGIALGNVGPVVRMLGGVRPAFLSDTDSQTLFSGKYTRAACSQYGIDLSLENVGPPFLEVFHQYNTVVNALACGTDFVHLAHWGELYDPKHWFGRTWAGLAPVVNRYRAGYVKSDAALFHSYVSSWYRPERQNIDALRLYDATNTLWHPDKGYPSWGRALGSPDVLDDAMIEDGALKGRKLLVIPNASVTLTTRKAVEAIREWVRGGGTLVGFGPGCLAFTVEVDRSVRATPGLAGLVPTAAPPSPPKVGGGGGGQTPDPIRAACGKGRVILYPTPADPERHRAFCREMLSALARHAAEAGARRWCRADPADEANLLYCGKERRSGRHLFAADFTRYVRNGLPEAVFWTDRTFAPTFHPSLVGEAELVGITDSFEQCQGGEAEFDAKAHTLTVRFRLPLQKGRPLRLAFGKGTSGLTITRSGLTLWEGDGLVLRPNGEWGQSQTQRPIRVGADGSLQPEDAVMLRLVHGDMHREKWGRGPTLRMALARPGSVAVRVDSVALGNPQAGKSGAVLVVVVDGKEALRQDLPDKDGENRIVSGEYGREFSVAVPAGEHEVRIDNEGGDWLSVERYVIKGLR